MVRMEAVDNTVDSAKKCNDVVADQASLSLAASGIAHSNDYCPTSEYYTGGILASWVE